MAEQVYQPRNPKASPLWRCFDAHFEELARDDETVAAVLAFATEDDDMAAAQSGELLPDEFRHRLAGVFHER